MDNSAVAEAITVDGILHWLVVSVGINAQTVYFVMTEIKAGSGNAFGLTVGGNPVNCAVRLIGVPGTIFNDGIIGSLPIMKAKPPTIFSGALSGVQT